MRVALPRGGGRLMRKESAIRVLLDVARQLRFRLELQDGDTATTSEGLRIKPPLNR